MEFQLHIAPPLEAQLGDTWQVVAVSADEDGTVITLGRGIDTERLSRALRGTTEHYGFAYDGDDPERWFRRWAERIAYEYAAQSE